MDSTKKYSKPQKKCSGTYPQCTNVDVRWVECPYVKEIYSQSSWCWLCRECYQQRVWDT